MLPTILGIGSLLSGVVGSIFGNNTTQNTNQVQDSTTNAMGSTVAQSGSQELNDQLLSSLNNLFQQNVGGSGFNTATNALQTRIGQVQDNASQPGFDVNAFVDNIMKGAKSTTQAGLENNINSMSSSTGSSANDNTMTSLLANRMRSDAASSLASTEANATATGTQIQQAQQQGYSDQLNSLSNSLSGQILSLIEQTKGTQSAATQTNTNQSQQVTKTKTTQDIKTNTSSNPFSAFADMFKVLGNSAAAA
jgi:hypothetical protein